ncbi:TfuA-related McrA-glycine thioamidation protein [uncultured Methanobrevibacter sp.]|uniref:TfuA-related McrA-glycine thioamidation protein n=1 Tax=uncultured Methanobrevibacter sp. TaxID=253161 RepID=UPI0026DF6C76|nr:TfuA-related McrA-glycine thioamidation protein [uncultured Methanobrevibacter sp.]
MKAIIYTGLSVDFNDAKEILNENVVYKPPIKRGDIDEVLKENPDIIGIIDGVFHQSPAVAHKEILKAMENGVKVIGSSSMGALRASELDSLGMIGIGYVYEQYRDGKITSDDDVAVSLDKDTLEAISVPLVNMEYVFRNAEKENIITEGEKEELLKIAKEIYYPKRLYSTVLNKSSLDNNKKDVLIDFIAKSKDIKKEDGLKLIKYIKELIE